MLLDIKNFAQNQRERQNLLNQEADLAFKQLCKTIEDIPTTEFDKFFNPKLKKEIEHYYQDIEYYHQHATYNKPKATLEIDITKESLIGIYKKVNDNTSAIDYWDARRKADNVMYSMDIANEIIIDGLTKRLSDYLKSADENLIIKTGNQIKFDDRSRYRMIVQYPTTELP